MKTIIAAGLLLLAAAPARAIELSLEENRAERGSVGYVDMQRLFAGAPEAARAKESFQELVRQAEDRVNARKAELLKLRQDLAQAKTDREEVVRSTPAARAPAPKPAPPPAPAAPQSSTKTLAMPGMGGMDQPLAPAAPPAPAPEQAAPSGPTVTQRAVELDGRILALQVEIDRKEAELKKERDDADRGLIDVENRRTDQVLARLYRAVSDVARKEGVSVVVDKSTILFGHPAVDLTDKVLAYLKAPAASRP